MMGFEGLEAVLKGLKGFDDSVDSVEINYLNKKGEEWINVGVTHKNENELLGEFIKWKDRKVN